ncbi:MAG: hypothetical protein LBG83_07010 [Oscillospiraceae bacterium]|jgi:hypothetical protein|nr:hypothetical protein [Oscillospiraceae bacterium]
MSAISAMPEAIVQWLAGQETLTGLGFMTEFPAQNKAVPLRSAIVTVGLGSVNITDKFIENDNGVLERQEYCRTALLRLRFGIHVPFSEGGKRCHEILTRVLDMLSFASDLNIRASGCKEVAAHRDTDAFVLESWIDVEADFCPAESTGLALASFFPKELLCGSHISNQEIHLTQAQKSRLDNPLRVGTYAGNGLASQSINLGQRPMAVFVLLHSMPPMYANYSAGTAQVMFGLAIDAGTSRNSLGVEITNSGFRLHTGTAGTTTAALNLAGAEYVFMAMV